MPHLLKVISLVVAAHALQQLSTETLKPREDNSTSGPNSCRVLPTSGAPEGSPAAAPL
jgi:hypothetical protein